MFREAIQEPVGPSGTNFKPQILEYMRAELPGFESQFSGSSEFNSTLIVRGPRLGLRTAVDDYYLSLDEYVAQETADRLIHRIRNEVIEASGLGPEVERRVNEAFEKGRDRGFSEGVENEAKTHKRTAEILKKRDDDAARFAARAWTGAN